MKSNSITVQATADKKEDPFKEVDRTIPIANNSAVAIGRVLKACDFFPHNVPGERISISPATKGQWLAQQGLFALEIASVTPAELKAVGGVDKYLAANPAKDKMKPTQRKRLPSIPGKPKARHAKPWDFVEQEE